MANLCIAGLDHAAIVVADVKLATAWYEQVLGLERKFADVWGDIPVMLVAPGGDRSGVALFPISVTPPERTSRRWAAPVVDHVAFRVDRKNFEHAREHLRELGIPFEFENHTVCHSIYFADPDGHRLELTTHEL